MLTTYQKQAKMKLMATLISLVVIAGVVMITDHLKAKNTAVASNLTQATSSTQSSTVSSDATGSSTSTTSTASGGYKDGTYTASSSYYVPHGNENIQVSLTLSNGTITSASIQNSQSDPTSAQYQQDFMAAYKSYVVGKKISGMQLSVVSGASDTTQGFNDALRQITSKAQA